MVLRIDGPDRSRELDRDALEGRASADAARAADRWSAEGACVPAGAVLDEVPDGVDHAVFHAADGYAVCLPLDRARTDAVLVVPRADDARVGVRLVVDGASSACFNVKAVTTVELRSGPGKHTVDPNPHDNAFVPGWDSGR